MLRIHRKPKTHSNEVGYQRIAGDITFSSPLLGVRLDESRYISPDTSEKLGIGCVADSSISSIRLSGDGIALFEEGSFEENQLYPDYGCVDHVSELLIDLEEASIETSSSARFKEELIAELYKAKDAVEQVDTPAPFKLTSVMTSPNNRVRIDESFCQTRADRVALSDGETPKVANGMQLLVQGDAPNFSAIVSPISVQRTKQEDHSINVELSDWSFNVPASSDDKNETVSTPIKFDPESQWVTFEPFAEFGNNANDEAFSFTPYVPEASAPNDNSNKLSQQLEEMNLRLLSVQHILRNIERQSQFGIQQSICDDRSIVFSVDNADVTNDDRTCTPSKNLEAKSALFSRFFGNKKSQLVEI
jgi:hypothetical protein